LLGAKCSAGRESQAAKAITRLQVGREPHSPEEIVAQHDGATRQRGCED
jgi:hypothetical protein